MPTPGPIRSGRRRTVVPPKNQPDGRTTVYHALMRQIETRSDPLDAWTLDGDSILRLAGVCIVAWRPLQADEKGNLEAASSGTCAAAAAVPS